MKKVSKNLDGPPISYSGSKKCSKMAGKYF
jgi:hypothetical protein